MKEVKKIVKMKMILRYHSISAKHYTLRPLNFKEPYMYLYAWAKMDFLQSKLFVHFNLRYLLAQSFSFIRLRFFSRIN